MSGKSQFLMETNEYCFLCLQMVSESSCSGNLAPSDNVYITCSSNGSLEGEAAPPFSSNNNSEPKMEIASFQKVCQYLRTDLNSVFKETITILNSQMQPHMEKWDLQGWFCTGCAQLTNSFTELHLELEKIQTKVSSVLTSVHKKMKDGERDIGHLEKFQKAMMDHPLSIFHLAFVERLRQDTLDKFSVLMDKNERPSVVLSKVSKEVPPTPRSSTRTRKPNSRYQDPDVVVIKRETAPPPDAVTLEEAIEQPAAATYFPVISSVRGSASSFTSRSTGSMSTGQPSASSSISDDFHYDNQTLNGSSLPVQIEIELATATEENEEEEEVIIAENVASFSTASATAFLNQTLSSSQYPPSRSCRTPRQSLPTPSFALRKKRNFTCPVPTCTRTFILASDLTKHRKRFHDAKIKHKCFMCPGAFATEHGLKTHILMKHVKAPPIDDDTPVAPNQCDVCRKKYRKRTYMVQHRATHFGKSYKCGVGTCDKRFAHSSNLYAHRKRMHKGEKPTPSSSKRTASASRRQVTTEELNETDTFPSTFAAGAEIDLTPTILSSISKRESIDPPEEIEFNSFIFPMGGDDENAEEDEEDPISPEDSVPIIFDESEMDDNEEGEDAQQEDEVEVVEDTTPSPVANPPATSAVPPAPTFKCLQCSKEYAYRSSLRSHVTKKHKTRPNQSKMKFHCDICDKPFAQHYQLKIHLNTSHFVNPFKCSSCPNTFSDATALRHHLRTNCRMSRKTY